MTNREAAPRRVLVVDDEADFAAFMASMLSRLGYSVSVARDGEEALELVRLDRPDVITLDIQMPKKSGMLFYRDVKLDQALRDIPVIIVSGLPNEEPDCDDFVDVFMKIEGLPHPEAYLDKPVYPDRLEKVLRKIFARGQPV
jgi:CheY-like chemotaxis protein